MANVAEKKVTPDDAVDMARELLPSRISSHELGLKLGLKKPVVEHIHRTFSEPQDRLFHVLIQSTSDSGSRPTWRAFGEALRSPEVGLPPALAEAIETAYSSSKPVEKVPHSAMADEEEVKSKPTLVESLKERVKSLRLRFRSIRKSTVQTLEKCHVAVVTVVSLVTTILGFNVRNALQSKHHKDLHECKDHWELFGFLNLYWNYLSFNLLKQLLHEHPLKDCLHARMKMMLHTEDVEEFKRETPLVLYSSAIFYPEFTPPGFQKMVSEHKFSDHTTFQSLEVFQGRFLNTFGLPGCVMVFCGVKMGLVKVTWFVLLPTTVIQQLKGSQSKIKLFRDFKITLVEVDGEQVFHTRDESKRVTTEATAVSPAPKTNIYKDDPSITWNVLISSLHKGSGFIDGVVLSRQIKSHNVVIDPLLFDFRHIIDLLRRLDAVPYGFKIFYRCLRETQVICRGHQKLADDIEREAKRRPPRPAQKPRGRGSPTLSPATQYSYLPLPTREEDALHKKDHLLKIEQQGEALAQLINQSAELLSGDVCSRHGPADELKEQEESLVAMTMKTAPITIKADFYEDDPYITWSMIFSCLHESSGYIETHILSRQFKRHDIYIEALHRFPLRRIYCSSDDMSDEVIMSDLLTGLHQVPNGFQIFYHCLRETQDICDGHQILADNLERKTKLRDHPIHFSGTTQTPTSKESPVPDTRSFCLSGPTRIRADGDRVEKNEPGIYFSSVGQKELGFHPDPTTEKPEFSLQTEDTLFYSGDAFSYVSRTGVSLFFPAAVCPRPVKISVRVVNDDYILPPGFEEMPIVSDMYKITASEKFLVPVTLRIKHCAVVKKEGSLVHIVAHGPPPYRFNILNSGNFPLRKKHGDVQMKQFSIFAILAQKLGWRMSLSVQLFYHKDNSATFVATKNTQSLIQAVKKEFADTVPGSRNSIVCDYTTEAITLSLPDEPQSGWTVVPDFDPPQLLIRLIREYKEGKTPPSITLNMMWTGDGEPKPEKLKIKVQGCSINSFTLSCKPSTTSCVSPHHQSPQQSLVHQPTVPPSPLSLASSIVSSEPHTPRESHASPEQPSASSLTISAESRAHQSLVHQPTPQSPLSLASSNLPSEPHTPRESHASPEQPSASSLSTMSPESRALRRSNTIFTTELEPEKLVTVLYSILLITCEEKARAMQQTLTVSQKLEEIFQIMERRVSTTPGNFHTMIRVLKAEPATKAVGEKIQGIYDEECKESH